ncbi:MAG: 30S ribosomal protein S6 [Deltaproteobacteria bacterium]|nr:30S ribosomal protein S6 [Deltaproteobacteria bacterium]
MRRYETILIADANLVNDELIGLIERYKAIISGLKGIIVKIEEWGKRKLAYEIKKQSRGSYILIDYAGESDVVDELERNLKIDDKILKFLTVKKSDSVDIEGIEKEIASTKKVEKTQETLSISQDTVIVPDQAIADNTLLEDPAQGANETSIQPESLQQNEDGKGDNA